MKTPITQPQAFRLLSLKSALKLETLGMKHSRGVSAYSVIKREFGLKGDKKAVLALYVTKLQELGIVTA